MDSLVLRSSCSPTNYAVDNEVLGDFGGTKEGRASILRGARSAKTRSDTVIWTTEKPDVLGEHDEEENHTNLSPK